jgi:hypothetical protein
MYNGLLNIYKEKDFTSHDVVAKLRGILRQKKIGQELWIQMQKEYCRSVLEKEQSYAIC